MSANNTISYTSISVSSIQKDLILSPTPPKKKKLLSTPIKESPHVHALQFNIDNPKTIDPLSPRGDDNTVNYADFLKSKDRFQSECQSRTSSMGSTDSGYECPSDLNLPKLPFDVQSALPTSVPVTLISDAESPVIKSEADSTIPSFTRDCHGLTDKFENPRPKESAISSLFNQDSFTLTPLSELPSVPSVPLMPRPFPVVQGQESFLSLLTGALDSSQKKHTDRSSSLPSKP